jgi:nucleoside recognition membrane protein YjiH
VVVKKSNKLPIYFLIGMSIIGILLIILVLPIIGQSTIQMDISKLIRILQDKTIVRSILIINVLVALFLIDKRFLKPYFQRKMGL